MERRFFKKIKFNHDKFSLSKKNTLRGLHCDFKSWKMVTSVYGKFLLVVVDMRKNSRNYLKHKKWIIDHSKPKLYLSLLIMLTHISVFQRFVYFIINGVIKENMLTQLNKTAIGGMIQKLI